MFFGEYEHSIDEKSRVTIPARFRDEFGAGLVLSKGLEANIDVYPREAWGLNVESRLAQLDPLSRETRELRRYFFGGAAEAELDKQGRVLVPSTLLRHASLDKEIVLAGVYDHLEIWERNAWAEHLRAVEGSAENAAERLANERS
jgi:MraZ protein